MIAGQCHGIADVCPKCRCLWQVNGEPEGILETWHAEAGDMFAHWAAVEAIPLFQPKSESACIAIAHRWRMRNPGLLV